MLQHEQPHTVASSSKFYELQERLAHWINTPENGYLGDDYGGKTVTLANAVHPASQKGAASIVAKLRSDIPELQASSIEASWKYDGADGVSLSLVIDSSSFTALITGNAA